MKRTPRMVVQGRLAGLLRVPKVARSPRPQKTPLERLAAKSKREESEQLLGFQLGLSPIVKRAGQFEPQFHFHPSRGWAFDWALEPMMLAVEIDGGGYVAGAHSRGEGIEEDCLKRAEAMMLGWRVLVVTPRQVKRGQALRWIELILQNILAVADGR